MNDAKDGNQGVWIEHSDRLYVAAYSSVASLAVRFSGYFRKMDGEIIEYAVTVNPASDRSIAESSTFFGAGFLLSCVASLASGSANRGQCYVRAMVQRSTGTPLLKLHNIVGGYLSDDASPSFPYGQIEGPLDGAGAARIVNIANPAAGATLLIPVPTGARWKIGTLSFLFTTAAAVANREVLFALEEAGNAVFALGVNTVQAASLTWRYAFGVDANNGDSLGLSTFTRGMPPTVLPAGARAMVTALNIQAADQFSSIWVQAEEWLEA